MHKIGRFSHLVTNTRRFNSISNLKPRIGFLGWTTNGNHSQTISGHREPLSAASPQSGVVAEPSKLAMSELIKSTSSKSAMEMAALEIAGSKLVCALLVKLDSVSEYACISGSPG
jgi:hypothetical protein